MNKAAYKLDHPYCELVTHFPVANRIKIVGTTGFPLFGGRCRIDASELHHVVGQTSLGRTDDERNVLHLNSLVHDWVTDHPCAGRMLCCWELRRKGVLDWAFLSGLDHKCWPGLFENPSYMADVERFPWLEPYHHELIRSVT